MATFKSVFFVLKSFNYLPIFFLRTYFNLQYLRTTLLVGIYSFRCFGTLNSTIGTSISVSFFHFSSCLQLPLKKLTNQKNKLIIML